MSKLVMIAIALIYFTDKRQQMNTVTHVLDASIVYGNSKAELVKVRQGNSRRLKEQTVNGRRLPPPDLVDCPAAQKSVNQCPFLGGDTRINTTREYYNE